MKFWTEKEFQRRRDKSLLKAVNKNTTPMENAMFAAGYRLGYEAAVRQAKRQAKVPKQ